MTGVELEVEIGGCTREIVLSPFTLSLLEKVLDQYNISIEDFVAAITTPPRKYFVRVNTLKTSPESAIRLLKSEGENFSIDDRIPEAIYTEVSGPFRIEHWSTKGIVVAERFAAERVLLGANLYAPGVVRILEAREGDTVTIVDETGTPLALGTLVSNPQRIGEHGIVVDVYKSVFHAPKIIETNAYARGIIFDQSFPSMLVARLLQPSENDFLLDLTASPGGKISHAYELSGGKALTVGVDHTWKKVQKLKENLHRLGHTSVVVLKGDSRRIHEWCRGIRPNKTIVDPPCTALGNRPRLQLQLEKRVVDDMVRLQKALLYEACRITVAGGLISYSTCTLTYEENEGIVEWALRKLPLEIVEPSLPLPQSKLTDKPVVRFMPGVHDYPGFFIAIFRRI